MARGVLHPKIYDTEASGDLLTLASMTGFARADATLGPLSWTWEVKSVNGRALDVRCRLPSGLEALELPARQLVAARLKRGNVNLALQVSRAASATLYRLNRELLHQLAGIVREAEEIVDAAAPRIDGLLGLRGVIEVVEAEDSASDRQARDALMLESLGVALDRLAAARLEEGVRLGAVLEAQIAEMDRLTGQAAAAAAARPETLKARLREQIAALMEAGAGLPEERLAQEVALLVTRGDVREELDRLRSHIAAGRELLTAGDPAGAGRRLDFLSQEFNREANTLCSKSGDVELTRIGLDLKLVIDRFREQVQNLE